jgi:hypothetical protein
VIGAWRRMLLGVVREPAQLMRLRDSWLLQTAV